MRMVFDYFFQLNLQFISPKGEMVDLVCFVEVQTVNYLKHDDVNTFDDIMIIFFVKNSTVSKT